MRLSSEDLPGSYGLPFLGEILELFNEQENFHTQRLHKHGRFFKTRLMSRKVAVLIGPEANQLVLSQQAEKFSSKMGWSILEPLLGGGLLLIDGEQHQRTRRLLFPAFHKHALSNYFQIIQNTTDSFLETWSLAGPVGLIDQLRRLSLLIMCRLLLGSESQYTEQLSEYFSTFVKGIRTVIRLDTPLTKFGRALEAKRKLESFLRSEISRRRNNPNKSQDILGLLLTATDELGNSLEEQEILTQSLLLLFAGHETTAKLLCWVLFELHAHSQWLDRLKAEQAQVVADSVLNSSHLSQFSQMANVLKEVERLYPPVYSISRGVIQDVEYSGYSIPAGWSVVLSPRLTHRLPEIYSNPELFDPDRFAPPREEHKKHPFALIGFGGGQHKCLGQDLALMEVKVILSKLLRNLTWSITPQSSALAPVYQPNKIETRLVAEFKKIR